MTSRNEKLSWSSPANSEDTHEEIPLLEKDGRIGFYFSPGADLEQVAEAIRNLGSENSSSELSPNGTTSNQAVQD